MAKAKKEKVVFVVPANIKKMTMGQCIDQLYRWEKEVDEEMAKAKARIATTEDAIKMLREHILDKFQAADLNGAKGKIGQCEIKQPVVPSVKDWDVVFTYVAKHKAWGLLQKRLSTDAWRERLKAKQPVPGVEVFHPTILSVKKL